MNLYKIGSKTIALDFVTAVSEFYRDRDGMYIYCIDITVMYKDKPIKIDFNAYDYFDINFSLEEAMENSPSAIESGALLGDIYYQHVENKLPSGEAKEYLNKEHLAPLIKEWGKIKPDLEKIKPELDFLKSNKGE